MFIHKNIKYLFCQMDHTNARNLKSRGVWMGWDNDQLVRNANMLIVHLNGLSARNTQVLGADVVADCSDELGLVAVKSPDHVQRYSTTNYLMEAVKESILKITNKTGFNKGICTSWEGGDATVVISFTVAGINNTEPYTLMIANRDTRAGRDAGFPCNAHIDLLESQWDPVAYRFVPRDHGYAVEYKDVVPYAPIFELRFEHKKQKHVIECNQFGRPLTYDDVVLLSQFNPNTRPKGSCSPGFHSYELSSHVVRSRVIRELNKMAEHFGAEAGRFDD